MTEQYTRKLAELHVEMWEGRDKRPLEEILALVTEENATLRKLTQELLANFLLMKLNGDQKFIALSMSHYRDLASLTEEAEEMGMTAEFEKVGKESGRNIGRILEAKKELLEIIQALNLDIDEHTAMDGFNAPSNKPN